MIKTINAGNYKVEINFTLEEDTLEIGLDEVFENAMYNSDSNISSGDIGEYIPIEDNNDDENMTLADIVKLKNSLGKVIVSEWTTSDTDNRFKTNLVECSSLKDIKNKFTNLKDYKVFEINTISDTLCVLVLNPKNIKKVCISVKTLYEKFGENLKYGKIYTENKNYYDLKDNFENNLCMDGESCTILYSKKDYDSIGKYCPNENCITLLNENSEDPIIFKLSLEEFKIATFS